MPRSIGFPPLEPPAGLARVLILGSLPGRKSLAQQQYYAHRQNAFWRIAGELAGFAHDLPYTQRVEQLTQRGFAVWDVLHAARRAGSLDSDIEHASATANDFAALLSRHPNLRLIAFNGGTAARLFGRRVIAVLPPTTPQILFATLPSTSPAFAALRYEEKLARWRAAIEPHLLNSLLKAP